jgi:maltooligosyltrehalose trehalohydrolase
MPLRIMEKDCWSFELWSKQYFLNRRRDMKIGADYKGDGKCDFVVWGPMLNSISVKIVTPAERLIPMKRDSAGYWRTSAGSICPGSEYFFVLEENRDRPDPASCYQPRGVHGPSMVIDHQAFKWEDAKWRGIPLPEMIMYELHTGAFSDEGDFNAIIRRLDDLSELGVNAIELMPVAQFPGKRNWGYDGSCPFAVQNSYGGPEGLKQLVNECHKKNIAVILDVVYNHLGPEGNYLWDYGPYFTDKYRTPWGQAINFDDAYSNEVRDYFIENALHWFINYHIDALRLDAIHGITDMSARPFLLELAEKVQGFSSAKGRKFFLIAESDLNDSRVIRCRESGGFGFDAQWNDDFHHCIHTVLTGENNGYYKDFGKTGHIVKALNEGFVYSGEYSEYRKRNHGNASGDLPAERFIVFSQNHDQTGNRILGERLSGLVSFEALKLAAGITLLSPYVPLLFMGEEYGEDSPFLYFVDHSDEGLIEAVRKGREEEFAAFNVGGKPPDPQAVETFLKSKIDWSKRSEGHHNTLLAFYKELIRLRKQTIPLSCPERDNIEVTGSDDDKTLFIKRKKAGCHVLCIFGLGREDVKKTMSLAEGKWTKALDSTESFWKGTGTLLPEKINDGQEITIKGESLAIYIMGPDL